LGYSTTNDQGCECEQSLTTKACRGGIRASTEVGENFLVATASTFCRCRGVLWATVIKIYSRFIMRRDKVMEQPIPSPLSTRNLSALICSPHALYNQRLLPRVCSFRSWLHPRKRSPHAVRLSPPASSYLLSFTRFNLIVETSRYWFWIQCN
jgi:hypothetical protein